MSRIAAVAALTWRTATAAALMRPFRERTTHVIALGSLSLLAAVVLSGCAHQPPLPLAGEVDLPRMYGRWYIVATIPNWFERGMVGPVDVFSPRPDGDIREDFSLRRGGFQSPEKHFTVHDWVRPDSHNAHWRVQIFWPIDLPFLLLHVDPDYRFALFGEADRSLGWIYARQPVIDDVDYRALLLRFQAVGYDSSRFRKVVQLPEQIGQPGFWSDDIQSLARSPGVVDKALPGRQSGVR